MNLKHRITFCLEIFRVIVSLFALTFILISYAVDTDSDGLPDDWEIENDRDPLVADYYVSAGSYQTCAIDDTGMVCWGSNNNLTAMPTLTNPKEVSLSESHSCALDDTGVVCWGGNDYGQTSVPSLSNPKQVAVASYQSCAIDDTGMVCWGSNNNLTAMPTLINPKQVSLSDSHSCALDDTGVVCWGGNNYGQTSVPSLSNPKQVSVSSYQSCAIDDTGMVCWGYNDRLTTRPTLINPKQVSLSDTHSCALDDTGVVCWRGNDYDVVFDYGETSVPNLLIDPDNDGYGASDDAFPLDALENIDSDGDGIGNNADLDDDNDNFADLTDAFPLNRLYSKDTDQDGMPDKYEEKYGLNKYAYTDAASDTDGDGLTAYQEYYLGTSPVNDDTDNDTLPDGWEVDNHSNPAIPNYQVAVGKHHICAIDDSGVVCWGNNDFGQTDIPDLSNPTQITSGYSFVCATDDSGVVCWGDNSYGQTDIPEFKNLTQIITGPGHSCGIDDTGVICWGGLYTFVPELINPRQVALGSYHSCAIDDSGVVCWGNNFYGQTTVPELINPTQISLGEYHSCAIDDSGVVCWGQNGSGQASVPELINPTQISLGDYYTCAIDSSGVVCWGSLANGLNNVPQLSNPSQISSRWQNVCAIDDSGVVCWGANDYGQLNMPSITIDADGDGFSQINDFFPLDASEWLDTDNDGIGNNADIDDDNDGVEDTLDGFPLDFTETIDSDNDDVGDNADADDDNDGVEDLDDAFPFDSTETLDTDSDGIGNNADSDDDGDGVIDLYDLYPLNQLYHADSDWDGMADAWEVLYGLNPYDPFDTISDQDSDGAVALQEFIEGTIPGPEIVVKQLSWDLDENGTADALTDGLILLRHTFGLTGVSLTDNAISSNSSLSPEEVELKVEDVYEIADIDADGEVNALTDGLILMRYLFGLKNESMIDRVVAPNASRTSLQAITQHIDRYMPNPFDLPEPSPPVPASGSDSATELKLVISGSVVDGATGDLIQDVEIEFFEDGVGSTNILSFDGQVLSSLTVANGSFQITTKNNITSFTMVARADGYLDQSVSVSFDANAETYITQIALIAKETKGVANKIEKKSFTNPITITDAPITVTTDKPVSD